jgi:hypothetical protein
MNADITLDTLSFKLSFSDKTGSERREVSRGVNLPEVLSIKHQSFTDSVTKRAGVRSLARIDRHLALADGTIVPAVSAYMVVTTLNDTGVATSDVQAACQRISSLISDEATSGLDLKDEIFVNKEQ